MRVTLISKACVVGAYQTKLEEIAAHDDVELTVVVPPYWRNGKHKQVLERAHTDGYQLIVTPMAWNGSFHLHYYPKLPAILRHSRPDICHIDEEAYNLATYLALRAACRAGGRTLFFTWQNLMRRYPPPFRWMEDYVHRHVDAAIAGSRDAAQILREKGYTGLVQVIPQFGVDPMLFHPLAERDPGTPFTVGYAGRLVEKKGLDSLADAVIGLAGEWRLILCGTGPLRGELEARFSACGLASRVHFYDQVASEEMPRYLRMMDVLVLPSRTRPDWKEQFGRVLIEAMACGVPVIGSDSGEIPNVIGDGGVVFAEGDAQALVDALALLRDEPGPRAALGTKGRARVLAHYTQSRIAAQTVAFYRRICSETLA